MRKIIGDRLEEERIRIGKKKGEMAVIGGVAASAYTNYRDGSRAPDAEFLAAIAVAGADVQYILTGIRAGAGPSLNPREAALVDNYRSISDEEDKRAVERTVLMAARPIQRNETKPGTKKRA